MARGEGVKRISTLFDKYKNTLRAPQGSVINTFCEVVDELIGVRVKKEQVSYNTYNKTIVLNSPGVIKSEIKINKKEILNHLKGRLGVGSAPKDII